MSTGWSTGWRVNLQARLRNGEKAYETLRMVLKYVEPQGQEGGTYPNLLDAHAPFQIDGNFGGCAGIMEMLVQSRIETHALTSVDLLPAIPEYWKMGGSVTGLRVRGGYEINMSWRNGNITSLMVISHRPDKAVVKITCGKKKWTVKTTPNTISNVM